MENSVYLSSFCIHSEHCRQTDYVGGLFGYSLLTYTILCHAYLRGPVWANGLSVSSVFWMGIASFS